MPYNARCDMFRPLYIVLYVVKGFFSVENNSGHFSETVVMKEVLLLKGLML
jgi:hypothetical protein